MGPALIENGYNTDMEAMDIANSEANPQADGWSKVPDLEILRSKRAATRLTYELDRASGDKEKAAASLLEWQRANAALQRAKKAVGATSETAAVTPEELVRLSGYRETVSWVIENMYAQSCPGGASKLAKSLWEVASGDKAGFLKTYMPLLLRGEKPEDADREDEAVKGNMQLIEEWFAQQEGVCDHCGRGP